MSITVKETTSIKLDKESKEKAKLIFKELGITMGDAFNLFLRQVNLHHGIPFELKIPSETTKKVIKEARQGKNVDDFSLQASTVKNLNSAILNWRDQLDDSLDIGYTEKELKAIRKESAGREFIWDK